MRSSSLLPPCHCLLPTSPFASDACSTLLLSSRVPTPILLPLRLHVGHGGVATRSLHERLERREHVEPHRQPDRVMSRLGCSSTCEMWREREE
eukprot:464130-Hanusia_phi.AAC.2